MKQLFQKPSILRVFTLFALTAMTIFIAALYAPSAILDFPLTFRVLAGAYLAFVLFGAGVVGLLLTRRGEPLLMLSISLILTPCFFWFWFSSNTEFLGLFSILLYTSAVGINAIDCFQRA